MTLGVEGAPWKRRVESYELETPGVCRDFTKRSPRDQKERYEAKDSDQTVGGDELTLAQNRIKNQTDTDRFERTIKKRGPLL